MKQWEYRIEYYCNAGCLKKDGRGEIVVDYEKYEKELVEFLNKAGSDGWELLNGDFDMTMPDGWLKFKRPIGDCHEND